MLNSFFMTGLDRRQALGLAGLAAASPVLGATQARRRKLDLTLPEDHLRTYIKMSASEEQGAETFLVYEGLTFGVTEGLQMQPLYGMLGFSPVRTFLMPDGTWRILGSEAAVFTDLATGQVLDTWRNPYLDDRAVKVWHLRTGPINLPINPRRPISTGGWRMMRPSSYGSDGFFMSIAARDEHLVVTLDAQANRKSPLDPAVWKAESGGATRRSSEHNTWRVKRADIENPDMPSPPIFASWHTNKEWRPWMLMGQRPGHIYNHLIAYKVRSVADAPRVLVDYYAKNAPEFLSAPKEWTGTYLTDWDHFMRNRTPQPPS